MYGQFRNSYKQSTLDRSEPYSLHLLNAMSFDKSLFKQLWPCLDYCTVAMEPEKQTRLRAIIDPASATPPDGYLCPLSLDLMDDPVGIDLTEKSDHTCLPLIRYFSKSWLLKAVSQNPVNPLTRRRFTAGDVRMLEMQEVDQSHLEKINNWRAQHPNYR